MPSCHPTNNIKALKAITPNRKSCLDSETQPLASYCNGQKCRKLFLVHFDFGPQQLSGGVVVTCIRVLLRQLTDFQ